MPSCSLPGDPSLEHLKAQAKQLQRRVREREADALELVREFHPRLAALDAQGSEAGAFSRADAQLVVARRYGFASWNRLRRHMSEPISIVALFEAPTVGNLAAYLRERHPDCAAAIQEESALEPLELMPIESNRPQDLLARIDALSDEEVEALLVEHGNVDAR